MGAFFIYVYIYIHIYFNFLYGALFFPTCTLRQHEETFFFFVCVLFFFFKGSPTRNKLTKKKSVLTCLSLPVSLIFRYRASFSFFLLSQ